MGAICVKIAWGDLWSLLGFPGTPASYQIAAVEVSRLSDSIEIRIDGPGLPDAGYHPMWVHVEDVPRLIKKASGD